MGIYTEKPRRWFWEPLLRAPYDHLFKNILKIVLHLGFYWIVHFTIFVFPNE